MNYSWIDIVSVCGIAQGLFLFFVLLRIPKNKQANSMLVGLMLLVTLFLAARLLASRYPASWPRQFISFSDTAVFLFGPLLYLYVKRLFSYNNNKRNQNYWYFLPAFLHFLWVLYLFSYDKEEYDAMFFDGSLYWPWRIVFSALLVVNFFFLFKIARMVFWYQRKSQENLSFKPNLSFIIIFSSGYFIILLSLLFYYLKIYHGIQINGLPYVTGWIILALLVYVVGYYAMIQPDVFRIPIVFGSNGQLLKSTEIDTYRTQLESLMRNERIYQDSRLTLDDMAEKLGLNPNKTSWLINKLYHTNFYDFVNKYRVEAFIQKLEQDNLEKFTFVGLAYEVGFNSKATFNRAFKKITDKTPSEFVKYSN